MSHLTQSMVERFFAREEENARGVLRKEMDSAMDTIFKQMKRKLMMLVESGDLENETLNEQGNLGDQLDDEQQPVNQMPSTLINAPTCQTQPSNDIPPASTNFHVDLNYSNQFQIDQITVKEEIDDESYMSMPSCSTNFSAVHNDSNQLQDEEIIVKNELGEIINDIIPNESIPSSSTQPSNEHSHDVNDNTEDCDCRECVDDLCVVKTEEGTDQEEDDHDNSQSAEDLIDESNDSNSRPTKRVHLDNDQPNAPPSQEEDDHDNSQSAEDLIDESNDSNSSPTKRARLGNSKTQRKMPLNQEANTHKSQKCSQCPEVFQSKHELKEHLNSVHPIGVIRCFYQDCNQPLNRSQIMHHYRTAHSTMFKCEHCPQLYKSIDLMHSHYIKKHQVKRLTCSYPNCKRKYSDESKLKAHEGWHRGVTPYQCRFPDCNYRGSANKATALKHIQDIHLSANDGTVRFANSSFYLVIKHHLL